MDVDNRESKGPSQLILCGQYWTYALNDFMTKCIPQPQIVIKNQLEAAIYANTHFVSIILQLGFGDIWLLHQYEFSRCDMRIVNIVILLK